MPDKKLEEIIERILQVIKPDKIILFGSRAKGNSNPDSDYDILVIKSGIEDGLTIEQNIYRKFLGLKARVDIIVESSEVVDTHKNTIGSIIRPAIKEGIVIYE